MNASKETERQKGMFTVEAVLIVPLMIFCILGIIYLSILLYQNTVAVAEATRAANRAAAYWSYIGVDEPPALTDETDASALITEESYTDRSPYRFIAESITTKNSKRLKNSEQYAKTRISGIAFEAYTDGNAADLTVKVASNFLSSSLQVTVNKKYINPLGNLLTKLGIGERQDYTSTASAPVTNPTEFIRNVDTLYDIGNGLWSMAKGDNNGEGD